MSMKGRYKHTIDLLKKRVDYTIIIEGGYVNDPSDSGGETKYGITYHTARKYSSTFTDYVTSAGTTWNGDMRTMPVEFARDVYVTGYINRPKFNLVAECSPVIAGEL